MNYKETLVLLREQNKLTQQNVASILNISKKTYNHYETQENIIPIKHLEILCNHFNISIDYFLGLSNNINYKNSSNVDKIKAGIRLKEFRKENKLTQKELANILNTTFSSIAWNEKGRNLIATPFLYTICKKYNISADYLLGRTNEPKYLK